MVEHKTAIVEGLSVFYREAGSPGSPKLVLLHGFPASSHQYRNLIPALSDRFHVIAPDYPGFGNSEMPDPAKFSYTFDKISEVMESFLKQKGFDRFGLFVQDYGGPVGFRIVSRQPNWLEWLIIQNTNAYEVGFTSAWDGFRGALVEESDPRDRAAARRVSRGRRDQKRVISTATSGRSSSARTTGIWISASWSGPTPGACNWTCSSTIERT